MSTVGMVEDGRAPTAPPSRDDRRTALLAGIDALETASRFEFAGMTEWARQLAGDADALRLPEVRLRAELVEADMLRRQGELAEAARVAERVRRWALDHDADRLLARSAFILSALLQELGDVAPALQMAVTAVDLLDDAVPAAQRVDHRVRLADCLGLSRDRAAAERYAEVLRLARDLGDVQRELMVLNNWAYTEALGERYEQALEICDQLQARCEEHAVPMSAGRLDTIARVLMGAGRPEDAVVLLRRGLRSGVLEASSDGDAGADFFLTLAEAHRLLGRVAEAQQHLDDCVHRCEQHGLTAIRVRARREQAELHAATGDYRAAFEEHQRYSDELGELRYAQGDARARAMQAMHEAAEARRQSRRYRELSLRDPLTGLYNRRYVDEELPRLLRADRAAPLSVALIDLDHFKRINDTCSHEVGDRVLRTIGTLLQAAADGAAARESFAARMGGEEFLLVLAGVDDLAALDRLEALRRTVREQSWEELACDVPVTISIGATSTTTCGSRTPADLLGRADAHLYRAKGQGRDRVETDHT